MFTLAWTLITTLCMITSCTDNMKVKKFDIDINDISAVETVLDSVESNKIAICNWEEAFPYRPDVSFNIFHTGSHMVIRFNVTEGCTGAIATENNGRVWEDSCVEFFISPGKNQQYYNFETNCIGTMHIAHREAPGTDGWMASDQTHSSIVRIPSLGKNVISPSIEGENSWTMILIVPVTALYADEIESWSGLDCSMNFYKCGDHMSPAHYLSWAPIENPKPAFHKPDFFKNVIFE